MNDYHSTKKTSGAKKAKATREDIELWNKYILQEGDYQPIRQMLHDRGITDEAIREHLLGADEDSFASGTVLGPCLVLPTLDAEGNEPLSVKKIMYSGTERFFITDGSTKFLFNLHKLLQSKEDTVYITEGELDAIRLSAEGLLAVSTAGGAGVWDYRWAKYFIDRDVVVVYDSDELGREGAQKVIRSLQSVARSLRIVDLFGGQATDENKDVTDFFCKGNTLKDFHNKVSSSVGAVTVTRSNDDRSLVYLIEELYFSEKSKRYINEKTGQLIFEWIGRNGGQFFYDSTNQIFLVMDGKEMSIETNNRSFESYLFEISGTTTADTKGQVIVKTLQALGIARGKKINTSSFVTLDKKSMTIHLNLGNDKNQLLEISPDGLAIHPNGLNPENIFLTRSNQMKALAYMPMDDESTRSALLDIERLVVTHLACKPHERFLVLAWSLCFVFRDLVQTRPLLRLEGKSTGGKSSALDILGTLIYGTDQKSFSTPAAMYAEGNTNPILFLDNIERRNLYGEIYDFLLTSATGINKRKRKQGTDSEVVAESPKCLVCTTGIENMHGEELINRCLLVESNRFKYGSDFDEYVLHEIAEERSRLMSGLFNLYSLALCRIRDGKWKEYRQMLKKNHPGHSKERSNGYLALMLLLTEAWSEVIGKDIQVPMLADQWLSSQDAISVETSIESNPVLEYLEYFAGRVWEAHAGAPGFWTYPIDLPSLPSDNVLRFRCFSYQLHQTLMQMMKGLSPAYKFKDARQLGTRIGDSKKILEAAGWKVTSEIRIGRSLWEFEHKLIFPGRRGNTTGIQLEEDDPDDEE